MFDKFDPSTFLYDLLTGLGIENGLAVLLRTLIVIIIIGGLSWLANLITRFIIDRVVAVAVRRTKFKWDDIFLDSHVFTRLSHIVPAIIIWVTAAWAFRDYPKWLNFIQEMTYLYMIIAVTVVLNSFLNALHTIYKQLPVSQHRPITGYVQVIRIVLICVALLIFISVVLDKKVGTLLAGLGAMAAVLILVFKDTILGLVASIQLFENKMIKIGDWITIPSKGVDGTVLDISLNTVKVQNFDKTIMTIPTYALVQDSFQNWSGMEESGGRRIKRSINIDMQTVKFIDPELKAKLKRIEILRGYIEKKEEEIKEFNSKNNIDESVLVNGRRMTNLGTFRAYLEAYLKRHPRINSEMTFLVRHLSLTETGLPVEIYVFSTDQEWGKYESLQADIFDHVLAVLPEFDLRVFQNPSGNDFRTISKP
ncbi:MAG: mechanosensitive ion channel [Bacteroidia bacterium]|nr:MAG: mechanosensitive ion channel [Bacteroidia bacterium]